MHLLTETAPAASQMELWIMNVLVYYRNLQRQQVFHREVKPMTYLQTLDKVEMEMSTCDEPRPPNGPSPIATASGQRWALLSAFLAWIECVSYKSDAA